MSIAVGCRVAGLAVAALLSTAAGAQVAWLGERDRMLAVFERQPLIDLERQWLQCARESELRMLDFEEAMVCSITHEVLLRRRFAGDFSALLAWWQARRGGPGDALTQQIATRP